MDNKVVIPLTILTGFLGAGKTTLLNRILTSDHGLRVAVLVNDFGSVNVDAELIVGVKDNIISLANGCTCCTLRDDLVTTVLETINGPQQPEYIVLEASGVADPGGIVMAFNTPDLADKIRLDSVTCVVDADQVFAHPEQPRVNQLKLLQIAFADMVILNKVSLAGPQKVATARAWIDDHFDNIRVFETDYAEVPDEVLLGVGRFDATQFDALQSIKTHSHLSDQPSFDTWTYTSPTPLSLARLEEAVAQLPATVFRCKGIVYSSENPERPTAMQVVSRRLDLSPLEPWRDEPATSVVVIAVPGSLDATALQDIFDSCAVELP